MTLPLSDDSLPLSLSLSPSVAQVVPPVPVRLDYKRFAREKNSRALVPQEGKPCPVYITPIKGSRTPQSSHSPQGHSGLVAF